MSSPSSSPDKIALVHLGCAKNLVDSEHMLGSLASSGAQLTSDTDDADVLVVNTCAFIGPAKQESIDRILEGERWKAERPGRRLVVAGCLAERYASELELEIPAIDAIIGTDQVAAIGDAVSGRQLPRPGKQLPTYLGDHTVPRLQTTPQHTAYLKISEGCDHTCSFCIIPTLRGKHRSRSIESLVAEAEMLAATGTCELNLVAQDSTAYGQDLGYRDGLSKLIDGLAGVRGIGWIRLHYAYPTTLAQSFIESLASQPKLVKYLDIPLQHAARPVLKSMLRGGDGASHMRLLDRVRERVPEVAIRTTFIVGYPNETDKRFAELVRFVGEAKFERVGVFTYSHEEGTTAGELRDRVPERVKQERRSELMQLQHAISLAKNRALVGTRQRVLVDTQRPDGRRLARLASQAPEVDGHVLVSGSDGLPGEFVDVTVTRATAYDLSATSAG